MVNRLLQDPTNKDVLIAATSIGVFKTFDGGTTWNTQMIDVEFIDMEFNPNNPTIIYGSTKYSQIFRSTDGNSFSPVFTDGNANRIELAVSPTNLTGYMLLLPMVTVACTVFSNQPIAALPSMKFSVEALKIS